MNLDELRSVQDAERRNSGLQHLRDSFYEEAGTYIADLKAERQRVAERVDDPWSSPEVGRLTDEIETAEEVVEAIYERRMGKLLGEASLAAAEMGADEEGLTAEERELFHDVVDRIRDNKARVLDTVSGEDGGDTGDAGTRSGSDSGSAGPTADPSRSGEEPSPTGDDRRRSAGDPSESPEAATGSGREPSPDRPEGSDGGDAGGPDRRAVEPGSPPPDGGRPGTDEPDPAADGVPAAGAMGSGSDTEAGSSTEAGSGTDPAPEPPSPDEFAGEGSGDGAGGGQVEETGPAAGSGPEDAPSMSDIDERVPVRITDDVGAIYGVDDREYDLERETIVHLPEANARPLVDRGAAERLDR